MLPFFAFLHFRSLSFTEKFAFCNLWLWFKTVSLGITCAWPWIINWNLCTQLGQQELMLCWESMVLSNPQCINFQIYSALIYFRHIYCGLVCVMHRVKHARATALSLLACHQKGCLACNKFCQSMLQWDYSSWPLIKPSWIVMTSNKPQLLQTTVPWSASQPACVVNRGGRHSVLNFWWSN